MSLRAWIVGAVAGAALVITITGLPRLRTGGAATVPSLAIHPLCESGPRNLADASAWVERQPDGSRSTSRNCANLNACSYVVSSNGATTIASDAPPDRRPSAFPPGFDRHVFRWADAGGDLFVHRTPDGGWLVAHNIGEFGAAIRWYGPDGSDSYELSREHVIGFSETPAGILAPAGLDHMREGLGGVLLFEPTGDRRRPWRTRWVGRFASAAYAFAKDEAGSLWLASNHALIEVTSKRELRVRHQSDWDSLFPTSMVVERDGKILVGMRGAVAELTRSASGWSERWLAPRECPIIERSDPKDYASCRCVSR